MAKLTTLRNQTADKAYRRFLGADGPPVPTWLPKTATTLEKLYNVPTVSVIEQTLSDYASFAQLHNTMLADTRKTVASPDRVNLIEAQPAPERVTLSADDVLRRKIAETQETLDALIEGLNPPVEVPPTVPPVEAPASIELPRCSDFNNDGMWKLLGSEPKMRARTNKRRQGPPSERQKYRAIRHGLAQKG